MALEQKYIDLLSQLIATPSYSREEGEACSILYQWMQSEGLNPQRKGNNIWCTYTGNTNAKYILLNAHIDTVHPAASYTRDPFLPSLEGDALYGLGSNDDGGSLIALLATYIQLSRQQKPINLIFSATAEEEVSGAGGLNLILPELSPIEWGLMGEPTSMKMAVAEKGLIVLDCTAHGRSGHAARNEGDNALYHALDDIAWLRNHTFDRKSEFLGPVKTTATMINCGTQHNVIPDVCQFVVDIRPNGLYTNEEIVETLSQHMHSELKPRSMKHRSCQISIDHPIVLRAKELQIELFGSPTASNQSVVAGMFPTVKIGPGESSRSHTADEFILISEIEQAINIYTQLLSK